MKYIYYLNNIFMKDILYNYDNKTSYHLNEEDIL